MLEAKIRQLQNPSISSSLLAFKPRQVLLAQSSKAFMAKKLSQDNSPLLHQSILHYLHLHGFSKTFKRFLQETHTQDDSWKFCSVSLEDIYSRYLKNCADNDTNSKGQSESEQCVDGTNGKKINSNSAGSQETISKKKMRKKTEDKNNDVLDASHPETVDKSVIEDSDAQKVLADKADMPVKKPKEKKKKKAEEKSEGFVPNGDVPDASHPETVDKSMIEATNAQEADMSVKKSKEKKKKKPEEKSEDVVPNGNDNDDVMKKSTKKDKKKKPKKENEVTDSKDSKKRKRLASNENVNQEVDGAGTEDSKRRKTESLEESKAVAEQGNTDNGHAENGNHQDELNNSAKSKSSRKECNGSAEPRTVNAFQRVKIEQVQFKDDRLKDNSYWAKDGAEIGYGAKAQEVLGQVKGRDFRHEKTKKKRGSYRGGQIDLQSHSVKFNYSDEE